VSEPLIPKHGGYRKLKSFQLAQLVYDLTVRFCDRYIEKRSRTHDQMVQAARSGVQNIAEGSQASGTSKKMELKLTNVARASLEELCLDYEDFLRQRGLAQWPPNHPALMRFKARRCQTVEEVREWVRQERELAQSGQGAVAPARKDTDTLTDTDGHRQGHLQPPTRSRSLLVRAGPCGTPPNSAQLVAHAALSLLNLACYFLDRQLAAQAAAFETEGGFTERLDRRRQNQRRRA
jgi:four helix bundle suffix protein